MPTQFEKNEANLARIFDPINEYSDRSLKLTLDDIGRQQGIADEERRAERNTRSQERIIAGAEARDRAKSLLQMATSLGIKIPKNATDEQVADLVKARKEEVAANALTTTKNLFDQDRASLAKRREQLANKRESIVNSSLSPLQKAQILKAVLSQPELANSLRKESREKVEQLLKMDLSNSKDTDVDSLVNNIYSDIKSNKFLFFGNGGQKVADLFNEQYHSMAGEMLSASKQADYADWMQQMKDVTAESNAIERGRSDALKTIVREHGAFLKPETIEKISIEAGPAVEQPTISLPQNLQGVFDKVGSSTPQPQPQPQPSGVPLEQRIQKSGAVGVAVDAANRNLNPLNTPLGMFVPGTPANAVAAEGIAALPDIASRFLFGDPEATPPTDSEVAAAKAGRDSRVMSQYQEKRRVLSGLDQKQIQAVQSRLLKMGVQPEQLKAGDELVKTGDLSRRETRNAIDAAMIALQQLSESYELPKNSNEERFSGPQ